MVAEEGMELDEDADGPELEDPTTIMRREEAKMKSRTWKTNHLCKLMVMEIVEGVESRSVVDDIMTKVIARSY